MFISITTTRPPATDLGWLLHKHPDRAFDRCISPGRVRVVFPEATEARCTAVLMVEVDPIDLVRGEHAFTLDAYVNDRPYAAGSMLAVALNATFRSAMTGECAQPGLADEALPLEIVVASASCRGGEQAVRRLFEPLGWTVELALPDVDPTFPDWGKVPVADLTLRASVRLQDALSQLYVLLPVLDGDKHYFVGEDEVDKLVRRAAGWLEAHPERERIVDRYLRRKRRLKAMLYERLVVEADPEEPVARDAEEERLVEAPLRLNEVRLQAVLEVLAKHGARSVVDLGCGAGSFLREAARLKSLERIVGLDVDHRSLEVAVERLESLPPRQRERIELLHGSLVYRDRRIEGLDAAVCVEVIEHIDADRLEFLRYNLFHFVRPRVLVITTPNLEHNVRLTGLPAGRLRHRDHRFEWTRAEFRAWCELAPPGWRCEHHAIGVDDPEVGPPTQMAVFIREDA